MIAGRGCGRWGHRWLLGGAALAAALAACGGDGDGSADRDGANVLTISVTDSPAGRFRYFAPRSIRGGVVEVRFTNAGRRAHKAQLWRVGGGRSVREALRARSPLPSWKRSAGGVGLTQPDRTATATQRLRPGLYYVAGAGNERGAVAPIRVTPGGSGRRLPAAPGRVVTLDYGFRLARLRAGRNRVVFHNAGKEPHHAFFAPMRADADLGDVRRFLAGRAAGPAPARYEGGAETVVFDGGGRQVTTLSLRSGRYAVLCFVRDRAGGPPHTEKGMISELRVP